MSRILLAVQRREKAGHGLTGRGIGLASSYVRAFEERAGSRANMKQYCRAHHLKNWSLVIKEAAGKLTYGTKDTGPIGGVSGLTKAGMSDSGIEVFGTPKRKNADILTPGSSIDYETILTTRDMDRDGDILEPMGANIDAKMPTLYQHLAVDPIGKHLCEVDRNEKVLVIANGLCAGLESADNAALLLEYGGLRTSHGFEPKEYQPVSEMSKEWAGWSMQEYKSKKDSAVQGVEGAEGGWHVKTYDVLESSLVSIPSNKGADITAFSRGKMTHPLFKLWTGYEYDHRPTVVKSGWDPNGRNKEQPAIHIHIDKDLITNLKESSVATKTVKEDEKPNPKPEDEKPAGTLEKVEEAQDKLEDEPNPGEATKITGALLKAIEKDVNALAKAQGLPAEAKSRCELIRGMIESVRSKLTASGKKIGKALKDMDIESIANEQEQMSQAMFAGVKRICAELQQVLGVEGLNDAQKSVVNEVLSAADATQSMIKSYMDGDPLMDCSKRTGDPADQTPFDEGASSWDMGMEQIDCPYPTGSDECEQWMDGWASAESQSKRKSDDELLEDAVEGKGVKLGREDEQWGGSGSEGPAPECPNCDVPMARDSDGDWECPSCGNVMMGDWEDPNQTRSHIDGKGKFRRKYMGDDDPYEQGWADYEQGMGIVANRYSSNPGSQEAIKWEEGWRDADEDYRENNDFDTGGGGESTQVPGSSVFGKSRRKADNDGDPILICPHCEFTFRQSIIQTLGTCPECFTPNLTFAPSPWEKSRKAGTVVGDGPYRVQWEDGSMDPDTYYDYDQAVEIANAPFSLEYEEEDVPFAESAEDVPFAEEDLTDVPFAESATEDEWARRGKDANLFAADPDGDAEPYTLGSQAAIEGQDVSSCPFPSGSPDATDWVNGFNSQTEDMADPNSIWNNAADDEDLEEKATVQAIPDGGGKFQVIGNSGQVMAGPFDDEREAERASAMISMGFSYTPGKGWSKSVSVKMTAGQFISWLQEIENYAQNDVLTDEEVASQTQEVAADAKQALAAGEITQEEFDEIASYSLDMSAFKSKCLQPAKSKSATKDGSVGVEETGDGGVVITLDGQVVGGPFHSAEEAQAALAELNSGKSAEKGWWNWALLSSGLATDNPLLLGLGAGGVLADAVISVIQYFDARKKGKSKSRKEGSKNYDIGQNPDTGEWWVEIDGRSEGPFASWDAADDWLNSGEEEEEEEEYEPENDGRTYDDDEY